MLSDNWITPSTAPTARSMVRRPPVETRWWRRVFRLPRLTIEAEQLVSSIIDDEQHAVVFEKIERPRAYGEALEARRRYGAKALLLVSQRVRKPLQRSSEKPRVSGKSKLAEALRYAMLRRAIFERFLAMAASS